jgi:hypothetical protein
LTSCRRAIGEGAHGNRKRRAGAGTGDDVLDRLLAELLLWGVRGGLAWLVAHEYAGIVAEKLNEVSRALGRM